MSCARALRFAGFSAVLLISVPWGLGCSGAVAQVGSPDSGGQGTSSGSPGGGAGGPSGPKAGGSSGGATALPAEAGALPPSGSSSSSGGVSPPDCSALAVPDIAKLCPDGTSVGATYVLLNDMCVLQFNCPTTSPAAPVPAVCNFPLPQLCEPCTNGETVCAHYAIVNGTCVSETCPPGTSSVPAGTCFTPGAPCKGNEGCGGGMPNGCTNSCFCDSTGHFQCSVSCPPPPPPPPVPPTPAPGCSPGAACQAGTGCGTVAPAGSNSCTYSCTCENGSLACTTTCPASAIDAGVPVSFDAGPAFTD